MRSFVRHQSFILSRVPANNALVLQTRAMNEILAQWFDQVATEYQGQFTRIAVTFNSEMDGKDDYLLLRILYSYVCYT